jgi:hypothetical protein
LSGLNCVLLLCIRNQGHHDFIKIAITYLKYNEFSHIGKKHEPVEPSNLEVNLEHIFN